ncbi:MAG: phasin family protein [Chromatiales bacterium]|nr:phasin family protein [Chromatiales bacterium]
MTKNDPFATMFNFNESALAPFAEFSKLTATTFEKIARYQYELAGDLVEASIEQAKLLGNIDKPEQLLQAEMDLGQALGKKLGKRSETLLKIASEAQQSYRDLAGQAVADVKAKAA